MELVVGKEAGKEMDKGLATHAMQKTLWFSLWLFPWLFLFLWLPPSVWHWWSRTMDMDNKGDWELKVVRLTRRKTKS